MDKSDRTSPKAHEHRCSRSSYESSKSRPEHIHWIGVASGKEELERFEQEAQCACEHGSSKRGVQCSVFSGQLEKSQSKEQQRSENGEDRKIPKVRIGIGPCSQPSRDERNLGHVSRRRERAARDGGKQRERERDEDEL